MGMKEQQKQLHRSANGKVVDMHKLAMQNEMTVAVGNVRVNARGDLLGPGGKIIKTSEDIEKESIQGVPDRPAVKAPQQSVAKVPIKDLEDMDPEGNE
jgi:hypothetical protein